MPMALGDKKDDETTNENLAAAKTPSKKLVSMPSGDHSEFAGVDAVATPAAAAALASAAGDSGGGQRRQKTPFSASSRPTAEELCAGENGPLSVPKIRNTPSRTTSLSAAVAATISLRNPDDQGEEPELRPWNLNIPAAPAETAAAPAAEKRVAAMPRGGRGRKRKA